MLVIFYLQLGSVLSSSLFLLVPQEPSQDLPAWTLGNGINEFDASLQPLMSSLMFFDMLGNITFHHPIIFLKAYRGGFYHECFGNLASHIIMHWYHSTICNCRVSEKMGLELGRSDLQALY
jgi:hypothetical protein